MTIRNQALDLAPVAIPMALKISPRFMMVFTIVQAITLVAFTAAAYWSIRHRNVAQHREWMVQRLRRRARLS